MWDKVKSLVSTQDGRYNLELLPVWTKVFHPYINVIDNIYEIREGIIKWVGENIVDQWAIELFYELEDWSKINVLSWLSDNNDEVKKTFTKIIKEFKQKLEDNSSEIKAKLEEHKEMVDWQLQKNNDTIKALDSAVS